MFIKKIALVFLSCLALIFAFHQTFVQWSIQLYLSHAAAKAGFALSYDNVQAKPNQLFLHFPELLLKEGQGKVAADMVSIAYSFHPLDKSVDFEVECTRFQGELNACQETLEHVLSEMAPSSAWFTVRMHIKSKDGRLKVCHQKNKQDFIVHVDHYSHGKSCYSLTEVDANGLLELTMDRGEGKFFAKDFPLWNINPIFHALLPDLKDFQLTSGVLDGSIEFSKVDRIKGALSIQEPILQDKNNRFKAFFSQIQLKGITDDESASLEFFNGSLTFTDKDRYGMMRGLKGTAHLGKDEELKLNLEGMWTANGEDAQVFLESNMNVATLEEARLEVQLHPLDPEGQPTLVRLIAKNPATKDASLTLNCINVRQKEFAFVQRAIDNVDFELIPIRYISGNLTASMSLDFVKGALSSVSLHQIDVQNGFLLIKPLEIALGADHLVGQLSFDMAAENPLDSLNASLEIGNGKLVLTGINADLWDFTHIQTNLEVQNGVVQGSSASVQLAGLKGKAEILSSKSQDILHLSLSGKGKDLKPFVPLRIQNGIDLGLADDEIQLRAGIKKNGEGVLVEGILETKSHKSMDSPPIPFGFAIERLESSLPIPVQDSQKEFLASANLFEFSPVSALPLIDQEYAYLSHDMGYSGLRFKEGWFKAKGLVLEKFIDPFLFPDRELALSGILNVEGFFDGAGVTIRYGGHKVQLKNDKLTIEVPEIADLSAYHTFNFMTAHNYGYLPLLNTSYFDQGTGLFFSDIQSNAVLEGRKIHFDDLEAYSNNLYFLGTADVDYSSDNPGAYKVNLHADTVEGSFSAAQQFFDHFEEPFFFTKVPLEGVIGSGPEGVDIIFDIREDDYEIATRIDGSFSEGKIMCPNADLSAQELSWNFTYDQMKNTLSFKDIHGMLLLGKPENVDEYSLHSDHISFTDFKNNVGSFDVWIKDAVHDFVRIKGNTAPVNEETPETVAFHFDLAKTHFGTLHPESFELVLTDWNRIDHLELVSCFKLTEFIENLNHLGSSEIFGVSRKSLHDLKTIDSIKGDVQVNLGFQGDLSVFDFNVLAKDVHFNGYAFQEVNLTGYNRDDRWIVEQLQMDNLSAAVELTRLGDEIKIDFLGIRFGELLLLGLEGIYKAQDTSLFAKVNLFEADLGKVKEWEKIQNILPDFPLRGKIKANGELLIAKDDEGKLFLKTALDASLHHVKILETNFSEASHFNLRFASDEGLTLKDFKGHFTLDGHEGALHFDLKELYYDFMDASYKLTGFGYEVDASLLPWTGRALHRYLPKAVDKKLAEHIGALKKTGAVKGQIDLLTSSLEKNFRLSFEDGQYDLFGEDRNLKNITIDSQQDELKVSALYQMNRQPMWISAKLNPRALDQGSMLLADAFTDNLEHPALILEWRTDPTAGLIMTKASGYLAGLQFDLKESKTHKTDAYVFRLEGDIKINGRELRPLLTPALMEAVDALKIGNGYKLQGEFELGKTSKQDIRFFGKITGRDIELKGYQFNQLSAQVIYEPSSCQFLNCTLSDLAGTLHIANLRIDQKEDGSWALQAPLLSVHELRPSILQPTGAPRPIRKPLVIRQLYLNNLTGILGDLNSFKADGQLYFVNPQKKHIQNILFSIPSEILTRIGLDLSVLTPVTGNIQFDLNNGYFVLKKFKDVYSEGKISKFYLPSSGAPSTIGTDGNVSVQVKFKQSTLLLKLAELFTINVKGHITEPKYSLQRQKYLKQEELFSSEIGKTQYE